MKKLLFLVALLPCLMVANDGFGALGAGGIIIGKTNDIAMAKEVLDISYEKISVDYEFINESDHDITETIVFPLPAYLVGNPNPSYTGTIPHFSVTVNGRPVTFKTRVRAELDGKDITQTLRDIGLSEYEIIMADERYDTLIQKYKSQLMKAGILDPEFKEEFSPEPLWDNYVTYEWTQTFKAHETLKVSHSYKPLPGGAVGVSYDNNEYTHSRDEIKEKYCASDKMLDVLDKLSADERNYPEYPYPCLPAFDVNYIVQTANTWKDGVRDFHLILRAQSAKEIVSTCFVKPLQKTTPTTYEVRLKNFKPTQDLSIYFGNLSRYTKNPIQPLSEPPIYNK